MGEGREGRKGGREMGRGRTAGGTVAAWSPREAASPDGRHSFHDPSSCSSQCHSSLLISRLHRKTVGGAASLPPPFRPSSLLYRLRPFCPPTHLPACIHVLRCTAQGFLIGPGMALLSRTPPPSLPLARFAYGWTEMAALDVFGHRVRGGRRPSVRPI